MAENSNNDSTVIAEQAGGEDASAPVSEFLTQQEGDDLLNQALDKIVQTLEEGRTGKLTAGEMACRISEIEKNATFLVGRENERLAFEDLARRLAGLNVLKNEYAGVPQPIEGIRLQLHKRYPLPSLHGAYFTKPRPGEDSLLVLPGTLETNESCAANAEIQIINRWYSRRSRQHVVMYRHLTDGKIKFWTDGYSPVDRMSTLIETYNAACVWSLKAERKACAKLRKHVNKSQFEQYMLTGMLLEESPRSLNSYIFRRSRPTVVLGPLRKGQGPTLKLTLCLHPLGFYQSTFAGCYSPTDDVIAHLLMMRTDEKYFWRKANKHSIYSEQSGI